MKLPGGSWSLNTLYWSLVISGCIDIPAASLKCFRRPAAKSIAVPTLFTGFLSAPLLEALLPVPPRSWKKLRGILKIRHKLGGRERERRKRGGSNRNGIAHPFYSSVHDVSYKERKKIAFSRTWIVIYFKVLYV
jgi:hypothetical protein